MSLKFNLLIVLLQRNFPSVQVFPHFFFLSNPSVKFTDTKDIDDAHGYFANLAKNETAGRLGVTSGARHKDQRTSFLSLD